MTEREAGKIYRGFSEAGESAIGPVAVFVEDETGRLQRLKHQVRHSPSGFSWGYAGSGPADLARSILADHLGFVPHPSVYQQFKRRYVAHWEQGKRWRITSAELSTFLADPELEPLLELRDPDSVV